MSLDAAASSRACAGTRRDDQDARAPGVLSEVPQHAQCDERGRGVEASGVQSARGKSRAQEQQQTRRPANGWLASRCRFAAHPPSAAAPASSARQSAPATRRGGGVGASAWKPRRAKKTGFAWLHIHDVDVARAASRATCEDCLAASCNSQPSSWCARHALNERAAPISEWWQPPALDAIVTRRRLSKLIRPPSTTWRRLVAGAHVWVGALTVRT